ncbi:MAG: efflux RND transporter periplasmic adaptor subunit [Pseudomonadales bacterium]|nr:efflux RND transporter periplasmic adaptor subunit [Pseudomonadales bacterium]
MIKLNFYSLWILLFYSGFLLAAEEAHEHEEEHRDHVEMSAELAGSLGIEESVAGPATLHQTLVLYGKVSPDPGQISHLTARYPGLIESVQPGLGDHVQAGDLLATIEANDSLQSYELRAPISGIVVDMHANPGEFAGSEPLLTVANYSQVWADLNIFPGQVEHIQPGQQVRIAIDNLQTSSEIRYLNPGQGLTPYVVARAPIANTNGLWTPGLLVEAEVSVSEFDVPVAVDNRALQEYEGETVVFVHESGRYNVRHLELGRSDDSFTEVLDGLIAGENYVTENSYLLKADLEKSGAAHNH